LVVSALLDDPASVTGLLAGGMPGSVVLVLVVAAAAGLGARWAAWPD